MTRLTVASLFTAQTTRPLFTSPALKMSTIRAYTSTSTSKTGQLTRITPTAQSLATSMCTSTLDSIKTLATTAMMIVSMRNTFTTKRPGAKMDPTSTSLLSTSLPKICKISLSPLQYPTSIIQMVATQCSTQMAPLNTRTRVSTKSKILRCTQTQPMRRTTLSTWSTMRPRSPGAKYTTLAMAPGGSSMSQMINMNHRPAKGNRPRLVDFSQPKWTASTMMTVSTTATHTLTSLDLSSRPTMHLRAARRSIRKMIRTAMHSLKCHHLTSLYARVETK
jgi:hypothetical protein